MPAATLENRDAEAPTVVDRIVDAARHAADLSHEARLVRSLAQDAVEDGVHAARRTVKSVQRGLEDVQDEAVHYVRRQPFKAIGIAAGIGLAMGVAIGWIGRGCGQRQA